MSDQHTPEFLGVTCGPAHGPLHRVDELKVHIFTLTLASSLEFRVL